MSNNNNIEFFGDNLIKKEVEGLWAEVFEASFKLVEDAKIFGFEEIGILPNPNVHQMLATLTIIDIMLSKVLELTGVAKLDTDTTRLVFNAKQQILTMEQIATALNNNDRASYDSAVNRLKKQASF